MKAQRGCSLDLEMSCALKVALLPMWKNYLRRILKTCLHTSFMENKFYASLNKIG